MAVQVHTKEELDAKFRESTGKLVVVDFFATWCGPCKIIAPFLDEIANKYQEKLVMVKVDVDEVEELVREYEIQIMPTFVFTRNGQHLDSLEGANKNRLVELIENFV